MNYRTAPQRQQIGDDGDIVNEEGGDVVDGKHQDAILSDLASQLENTTMGSDKGHSKDEAIESDDTEHAINATSQEAQQDTGDGNKDKSEIGSELVEQQSITQGKEVEANVSESSNLKPVVDKTASAKDEKALKIDTATNNEGNKSDSELLEKEEIEVNDDKSIDSKPVVQQAAGSNDEEDLTEWNGNDNQETDSLQHLTVKNEEQINAKDEDSFHSTPAVETAATKDDEESKEANNDKLHGIDNVACTNNAVQQQELPMEGNKGMEITDGSATTIDVTEALETLKDNESKDIL